MACLEKNTASGKVAGSGYYKCMRILLYGNSNCFQKDRLSSSIFIGNKRELFIAQITIKSLITGRQFPGKT